jgi:hypothetical protein
MFEERQLGDTRRQLASYGRERQTERLRLIGEGDRLRARLEEGYDGQRRRR